MPNDDLQPDIELEKLTDDAGNLVGSEASYEDGGRSYEIEYDENFNFLSETVTKLYDPLTLEGAAAAGFTAFDQAWSLIENDLATYTDGHDTITFGAVNDNQLVVLGNDGEVVLRVNKWSGEHDWTGWDGTEYNNKDYHYNFHDAEWNHIGNAGSYERYITADSDGNTLDTAVLDETGTHLGFSSDDATVVSNSLADYSAIVSSHLLEESEEISDISEVHLSSSSWQGLDHELRDEYFETWSDSNERIELRGENNEFIGSLELRDGFIEVRDENWQTVARVLDGDGISIDDIELDYPGFQDAWLAVKSYLPSEFQPDVEESSLKFSIDDWDNIIVFDANGAMIGRVHSWEHQNSWSRYEDGEEYKITNTSSGFNFNDADWNDIGRYETSDRDYTHVYNSETDSFDELGVDSFDDEKTVFTSYSISKSDVELDSWNDGIKVSYDLPDILTDEQMEQLGFSWDDVSKVSIGEEVINWQANQFRDTAEVRTDERIEYFETLTQGEGDNTWTYDSFLGSVENRDGYIVVRDGNWNEVARVIDVSSAKTLAEISVIHAGFEDAWGKVGEFLPSELQADDVRFTSDDWNIYAFSAAGELLSNINFWNGEHTWTGWDGTSYKNIDTNYNFHSADWSTHLANAGTFDRYIVTDTGEEIHDEEGEHSGYSVNDSSVIADIVADFSAGVMNAFSGEGETLDDVSQIRQNFNSWKGLAHDLRYDGFEEWTDSNERIELFKDDEDAGYKVRIGSVETRDGFIEVYDADWNRIARLVDGTGVPLSEIEEKYEGFTAAWDAVKAFTPEEFRPDIEGGEGDLIFSFGEWDNIMVFDADGVMIGRVNVWEHTNTWDNYNDGDRYTVENNSISFNFNDADWNNIGRYELSDRSYIEKNGDPIDPIADEQCSLHLLFSS